MNEQKQPAVAGPVEPTVRPGREEYECGECEGQGGYEKWKAVAGHYEGGEYFRVECDHCDGTGKVDQYGNPFSGNRVINCCFPDCGCDGARLCMAEKGASSIACATLQARALTSGACKTLSMATCWAAGSHCDPSHENKGTI